MSTNMDLISIELFIDGKLCSETIMKVEVDVKLNRIATAFIKIYDGNKAQEKFSFADSGKINPGTPIEVKSGYHQKTKTIFKGLIISIITEIDPEEGSSVTLKCKDEVVKSTFGKKSTYFLNMSDSDIIKKIMGVYTFSTQIDSISEKSDEIIQYNSTDWDFMMSRAEINGLVAFTDNGKLIVTKPLLSGDGQINLKYGNSIIDMNLTVNSVSQLKNVTSVTWNPDTQELVKKKSKEPTLNEEGSLKGETLAKVMETNGNLQTTMRLSTEVLGNWSDAQLLKSRLSKITGTITCSGNNSLKPNTLVKLEGVGTLLNGSAYVSGVYHEFNDGIWTTECSIGLDSSWFVEDFSISSLPASGRLPAINGLQIGKVKKIDGDPNNEFRVKVVLPLIQDSDEGIWARLSTFYASNEFGAFFFPEIDDEVILGFLDDNPSAPIILGSIYSKKNIPPQIPDDKNKHKTFVSKSKLTLDFDDEDKIITINTPGGGNIVISDKAKGITITDQTNNVIEMSESGIRFESKKSMIIKVENKLDITAKEISIKADTNTNIEGTDIGIKSSKDLNLEGANTIIKANMAFSAEGQASAEIKASGNTTIKGAMVNIN